MCSMERVQETPGYRIHMQCSNVMQAARQMYALSFVCELIRWRSTANHINVEEDEISDATEAYWSHVGGLKLLKKTRRLQHPGRWRQKLLHDKDTIHSRASYRSGRLE